MTGIATRCIPAAGLLAAKRRGRCIPSAQVF